MNIDHKILLNFNAPSQIKERFDETCRANGRTRTSVLVGLMNDYILSETQHLARRIADLEHADEILRQTRLKFGLDQSLGSDGRSSRDPVLRRSNSDFQPPVFIGSDWQEEF